MASKRPFLEDGSQFGVSRTQFHKMRKAEKRDMMLQWFFSEYEDPADGTCVYRKLKLGCSGDEVRPGWRVT
jgi:hypothetical protein